MPKGDPAFAARLKAVVRQPVAERTAPVQAQRERSQVPQDFFTAYVTSAYVGIVQHWLESGVTYSPEYLALQMTRIARYWMANA